MNTVTVDAAVAAIGAGPQGPQVAAIFDFGGTVVHGFAPPSAVRRLSSTIRRRGRDDRALADSLLAGIRGRRTEEEYERFLRRIRRLWAGRAADELTELGEQLFRHSIYGHLYPEAWRLIRAHEAAGHTVVLASCLPRFQVRPAAAELGIEHVLCTRMTTLAGVLTGRVDGTPLWHDEKAAAVRTFAADHNLVLPDSYAYADAAADLPLLELVGRPRAVNPDPGTALAAQRRQWPVLGFRPRQRPGAGDIARTAAGFASLIGGAAFGVASRAPSRDRQRMADAMMSRAADATLRACSVRLRIVGAEHARTPRPAVYVFNHQSQFDMVVLAAVLRSGFTGIVKQEVTRNPVFGPLMRFAGATFIDRSDTAGTRSALAPVVQTLRDGLSVVVAPEGTRSLTPRVGPFKKGAFHIAAQAGVPIVPLVIRNAGEIAWRNSAVVRKGTVDVAVLEPVEVSAWDPTDMSDEIERVRRLFIDTLLDWPAPTADSTGRPAD